MADKESQCSDDTDELLAKIPDTSFGPIINKEYPVLNRISNGSVGHERSNLSRAILLAQVDPRHAFDDGPRSPPRFTFKVTKGPIRMTSRILKSFTSSVSPIDEQARPQTAPSKPAWVNVFKDSCLDSPAKPPKDRNYYQELIRRQVRVFVAEEFTADTASSAEASESKERLVRTAAEDWLADVLKLRHAAEAISAKDLAAVNGIQIPNNATVLVMSFFCLIFGIAPSWTSAKRSVLHSAPQFLVFLKQMDPLNVQMERLQRLQRFKKERLDAVVRETIRSVPLLKLVRWIQAFSRVCDRLVAIHAAASALFEQSDGSPKSPVAALIIPLHESYSSAGLKPIVFFRFLAFLKVMAMKDAAAKEEREYSDQT